VNFLVMHMITGCQSFLKRNASAGVATSEAVASDVGGTPPWGSSEGVPGGV
jgi:hypothetical protein